MNYDVFILRRVQKALSKLQRQERERIQKAIYALAIEPRPPDCRKLEDRKIEKAGEFALANTASFTKLTMRRKKSLYWMWGIEEMFTDSKIPANRRRSVVTGLRAHEHSRSLTCLVDPGE